MKLHMMRIQVLLRLHRRHVDIAQRRSAVAGDVAGSVHPGFDVALALHHRQADQRLRAGDESTAALQRKFIVEGNIFQQQALTGSQGCVHSVSRPKILSLGAMVSLSN